MCRFMGRQILFYVQGFAFGVWEGGGFIKNMVIKIWSVVHIYYMILGTKS